MTPDPSDRPPAGLARRLFRHVRRWLLRLLVCGILLLFGAAVYLQVQPVPGWAHRRIIEFLARRGIHFDAEEWRLDWTGQVEATGFRWYDSGLRAVPVLEADRLQIRGRLQWGGGALGVRVRDLTVRNGVVRIAPGRPVHGAPRDQVLELRDANGFLEVTDTHWRIRALRASCQGLQIDARGAVSRRAPMPARQERPAAVPRPREPPAWLRELHALRFDRQGALAVEFDWPEEGASAASASVRGRGDGLAVRGVLFDGWRVEASYADGELDVSRLDVRQGPQALSLRGGYRLADRRLTAEADSSLPGPTLRGMLPPPWQELLETRELDVTGDVSVRLAVGPAPLETAWQTAHGHLAVHGASYSNVWLEAVATDFRLTEKELRFRDTDVTLGLPPTQGHASGDFTWTFQTGAYQGEWVTETDFRALLPILPEPLAALVRRFEFEAAPPRATVAFSGQVGDPVAFTLQGDADGADMRYRGASVLRASTHMDLRDGRLRLDPLRAEREDGFVEGWILVDMVRSLVEFDVVNTAPPKAVARAVSDHLERSLQPFSCDGPVLIETSGQVAYRPGEPNALRAAVAARSLGVGPFLTDSAGFDLLWTGTHLLVTNLVAAFHGGTVEGVFAYEYRPPEEGPSTWAVTGRAADVAFEDLVRELARKEGEPYRGSLDAAFTLAGEAGEGLIPSLSGEGTCSVSNGRILMIPLFGGLSRILSRIYPGLGFSRQSDIRFEFTIRGPRARMRNVRLEGALFSMTGKGDYDLVDHGLDYDVEFQLLREGAIGTLVQFVTRPITKLLEFDLEGTLEEPEWRPKNLPKELFVGFDEE